MFIKNDSYSLNARCLGVLSLITVSTVVTRYAQKGSLALQVSAVALAAITLIAAIDLVSYAWVSLKSRQIFTDRPEAPTHFIEFSSERGSFHWQFNLRGKQIEVKQTPWDNSLWFSAERSLRCGKTFSNEPLVLASAPSYTGPLKRQDLLSIESLVKWLETSPGARETAYKEYIDSPKGSGLILPVVWTSRNGDVISLGVHAAYRAIDLFLRTKENHQQTERITIVFPDSPEGGGTLPEPADVGLENYSKDKKNVKS